MFDADNSTISFSKNGRDLGLAFTVSAPLRSKPLFAACTVKNAELKFGFMDAEVRYQPEGYVCMGQAKGLTTGATGRGGSKGPLALVLEPSKELAEQTRDQINLFKKHITDCNVRTCLLMGGTNAKDQVKQLKQGRLARRRVSRFLSVCTLASKMR
eukprot:TRINITY_DN10641_c0_g1_i1.p1 TRINITY_DN10641_c0_g1~~TRINITY_DN10641_c0_g1_i1.p1  ORF type:complete len:156 (+),score=37.57 TRINITY_DN10641_c0_g1_i1:217-684(+)